MAHHEIGFGEMPEEDFIPISALQHYLFCPRQCALIHIECVWSENYLTAAGRSMHEKVDRKGFEARKDVHLATSLKLASYQYGLVGVADLVEFHRADEDCVGDSRFVMMPNGHEGLWRPCPVEYKRGGPKVNRADEVQLCAQAFCLEEMTGALIDNGALYYGAIRRRVNVEFDEELRQLTRRTIEHVRCLINSGRIPCPLSNTNSCRSCSIVDICQPITLSAGVSAKGWLDDALFRLDI